MAESELSLDRTLDQFDAVEIRNPQNPEQLVGRVGLVGTFYLPASPDRPYRERLGAFVDGFIDQHAGAFQWRTEGVGDKLYVRPLDTAGRFEEAARRLGADGVFAGMAGSSPAAHDYPESVPGTHQIQFLFSGIPQPPGAGYLRFNLPFAWERDTPGPALLSLVRELCDLLSPLHGSSGMGFVYPTAFADVYDAGTEGAFYAAARRLPGIDATPPLTREGELAALPTLNWLTAVSDPFLERLGGIAAVDRMLEAGPFRSYPYPGGVLYQAGSAPLAGDRDQGKIPLPYQQLYRALKPVMMTSVENPFVLDGVSEDEEAMYAAYARRFEE
ncbi:MAG: DUF3396 domain-containing protein [Candidatus Thiosymbion ectosymbiont of Robbea hypermnestra]|nr:DUF3396 domain-containing protein [Candidatus Thiosymbion ectosymbiont of Robbea hypermnestra]